MVSTDGVDVDATVMWVQHVCYALCVVACIMNTSRRAAFFNVAGDKTRDLPRLGTCCYLHVT